MSQNHIAEISFKYNLHKHGHITTLQASSFKYNLHKHCHITTLQASSFKDNLLQKPCLLQNQPQCIGIHLKTIYLLQKPRFSHKKLISLCSGEWEQAISLAGNPTKWHMLPTGLQPVSWSQEQFGKYLNVHLVRLGSYFNHVFKRFSVNSDLSVETRDLLQIRMWISNHEDTDSN